MTKHKDLSREFSFYDFSDTIGCRKNFSSIPIHSSWFLYRQFRKTGFSDTNCLKSVSETKHFWKTRYIWVLRVSKNLIIFIFRYNYCRKLSFFEFIDNSSSGFVDNSRFSLLSTTISSEFVDIGAFSKISTKSHRWFVDFSKKQNISTKAARKLVEKNEKCQSSTNSDRRLSRICKNGFYRQKSRLKWGDFGLTVTNIQM